MTPQIRGTSMRRRLADRTGRVVVVGGGLAVIASVLGILIFIAGEALPLARGAEVTVERTITLQKPFAAAAVADEYRSIVAMPSADGAVSFINLASGAQTGESRIAGLEGRQIVNIAARRGCFIVTCAGGAVAVAPVRFDVRYDKDVRRVEPRLETPAIFEARRDGRPVDLCAPIIDKEKISGLAASIGDGKISYIRRDAAVNEFSGEETEELYQFEGAAPGRLTHLLADREGQNIYAATDRGDLVRWRISASGMGPAEVAPTGAGSIGALELLHGDQSIAAGGADGSISIWFLVGENNDNKRLARVRDFPARGAPIRQIAASGRTKGFLALDSAGGLAYYHSTSARLLWEGESPLRAATYITFTPKADGAIFTNGSALASAAIDCPHPESGWRALFGAVWYENAQTPEFAWQSSPGSSDVEPKFSLTPLIFGTLKGTFYSLILAIPLAVLAAMYTSQFLPWALRKIVKPAVEIMASLPSVVLGFVAALWLAPRLAGAFPAFLLMILFIPASVVGAGLAARALAGPARRKLPAAFEIVMFMIAVAAAGAAAVLLDDTAETLLFDGDFPAWLHASTGAQYVQNNAIVVGIAMGFAVIPIIFSVSEEAFSNVPNSLVSAALALGANRWQTVSKIVLPAASPGVFSGVMIGFGRAIGETMIVVMATGVTAIMSWSPFNGFRPLSANIANEIPEAPHGGTLYRILFLSGLLLFMFTFAVNTVAELVRQNLRKRYSAL